MTDFSLCGDELGVNWGTGWGGSLVPPLDSQRELLRQCGAMEVTYVLCLWCGNPDTCG